MKFFFFPLYVDNLDDFLKISNSPKNTFIPKF